MNADWATECYLVDTYEGTREPISNGLVMKIAMPANHQRRYYIEGPDEYIPDQPVGPGITTGIENTEVLDPEEPTMQQPEKFFHNGLFYIRHTNGLYTITGVRVK